MPSPAGSGGSTLLLSSPRMLHPDGKLAPGWVRVEGGSIAATGSGLPPEPADVEAPVLSPGFVDIHCHGGGGHSFVTPDPAEASAAAGVHHRLGTTTVLASLVTAAIPDLLAQIGTLRGLVETGVLGGIHLEGPWLSKAFHGAHDPQLLTDPAAPVVERLLAAGGGTIRMVTLAPERTGALEAIGQLSAAGVTAAVGHTDADGGLAASAFDAGATVVTHLFNAMRPIHHRDPGPIATALADPRVAVEIIADGVHLHDDVLLLAARAATGGYLLITDAMAAAAAPDGTYQLGGVEVSVRNGVARTVATGAIAGSTLTMPQAVRRLVAAGEDPARALTAATRKPADAVGLASVGRLVPGCSADLVLLDEELAVQQVLRQGAFL
ncbi:N-acetylglucosamine-6-phosphate deacetylase [Arthrobacter sp.]|uniref:N-acetylglucosamine-6-phosphate deacetylase n=1 Tax=Arthrobacter sp. TaxID=1667 RepID=UPI00289EF839|nr:N-acetylglucosamine-6-phosphate deacetylase [Arthrobacter sp.]